MRCSMRVSVTLSQLLPDLLARSEAGPVSTHTTTLSSHDPGGSHMADEVRQTMKTDQGFERSAHSSNWVSMP
jgi:hypothetical protein